MAAGLGTPAHASPSAVETPPFDGPAPARESDRDPCHACREGRLRKRRVAENPGGDLAQPTSAFRKSDRRDGPDADERDRDRDRDDLVTRRRHCRAAASGDSGRLALDDHVIAPGLSAGIHADCRFAIEERKWRVGIARSPKRSRRPA